MEPGTTYRLCVGASCQARTARAQDAGPSFLQVALPDSVGARKVSVRFTATHGAAGPPAVDERRTVKLTKSQPNGAGCGPTAYQAGLTYDPGTGLSPHH
ncbi:hypothetical protein [Actinacidiphila acididurans]|uniref:Uncharacterized protein n=1 Tax=Actinacidiphila acididurans TaxID=2784346 RepID=A0ABS2TTX9_9ACTN|nr:hypothetical protein [Actinacidiphila acididurans]MBM9506532.1 hypothetical protein [Actinacidiphila acididurans]